MQVPGVTFGEKHSFRDFGLILSEKEIGFPEPKVELARVPGRDGDIDLTEALGGGTFFENRKLTFTFTLLSGSGGRKSWAHALSRLSNYLHGQRMKIILDADKGFYYTGRCTVSQYRSNGALGTLVVECDVEPYKFDVNQSGEPWLWDSFSLENGIIYPGTLKVDGELEVNLPNRQKPVSPAFTVTSNQAGVGMTAVYDGNSYYLPAGRTTVYDIRLKEGDNLITLRGNGAVQIEYKGGSL